MMYLKKIYLGQKNKQEMNVRGGIMKNKPRYTIVRVDNKCPDQFEKINLDYICRNISCYQGKECYKNFYGDTKEQLIRKVAQVLFKRKYKINERLYGYMSDNFKTKLYTQCLEASKEIVEFLGVEE